MLLKVIVILIMLVILASLASALVFLFRDPSQRNRRRMVQALTWRIGLSVALFVLLMAGFYFGVISRAGVPAK